MSLQKNTINNVQKTNNQLSLLDTNRNSFHNPVVFWGGTDINPGLYGEEPSKYTQMSDFHRDKQEWNLASHCYDNRIPMIGICRGAQLLNVFSGGTLCQHIEGHTQNHTIITNTGLLLKVNSTHHQMMLPSDDGIVLATDETSTLGLVKEELTTIPRVYEVVYYPETLALCIQFHPEWMPEESPAVAWLQVLVHKYFNVPNFKFKEYH